MNFWFENAWVISLVSGGCCFTAALQLWRFRADISARSIILIMLALTAWAVGYGLSLQAPGLAAKIFFGKIQITGIAAIPPVVFMLTLSHAGRERWLNRRVIPWLFLLPALTAGLTWTNEFHHFIFKRMWLQPGSPVLLLSFGPGFWLLIIAYPFAVVIGCAVKLLRILWQARGVLRQEVCLILLGLSLPIVAIVYYYAYLFPLKAPDPTAASFAFTALLVTYSMFVYRPPVLTEVERDETFVDLNFKMHIVRGLVTVVLPTLVYFTAVTYADQNYALAASNFLLLASIAVFYLLVNTVSTPRIALMFKAALAVFVGFFWLHTFYFMGLDAITGTIFWSLIMPLITILAWGPAVGFLGAMIYLASAYLLAYAIEGFAPALFTQFGLRFAIVYLLLSFFLAYVVKKRTEFMHQAIAQRDSLQESERRYRWATEAGAVGVWDFEPGTQKMHLDDNILKTLGYASRLPFQSLPDLLRLCPPEEVAMVRDHWEAILKEGRAGLAFEMPLRDNSDALHWFMVRGESANKGPKKRPRIYGTMTDITERRQYEGALQEASRQWEATFNAMEEAVCLLDADFVIQRCNRATAEFADKNFAQIVGHHCYELIHGTDSPPEECPLRRAQNSLSREEAEMKTRDRWLRVAVSPVLNEKGQLMGAVHVAVDITEQKRMEQEKAWLDQKLWKTQKLESLGVVAGGVAHDFNNLLAGIMGFGELVQGGLPPDSPEQGNIANLLALGQKAARLTRQMLDYTGQGLLQTENLDLSSLIGEMKPLLQASVSKKASLQFNLGQDLPPVSADEGQLSQVIFNLVINASESLADQTGDIRITTGVRDCDPAYLRTTYLYENQEPGPYVYLEVADNGPGVDPEIMDNIFDPFFSTKFTGRGLGLAVLLGIVRAHEGAIEVHNLPGRGASFRVLFPAAAPAQEQPAEPKGASQPILPGKVLVVDDEPHILELTSRILARHDVEVLSAGGGEEGIRLFREHAADLDAVILDYAMPGLSGDEVSHQMHKIAPDIPIILISGYSEQEMSRRFGEAGGFAGFLAKPFASQVLLDMLSQVAQ